MMAGLLGGFVGFLGAILLAYLPGHLAGTGNYESIDAAVVFTIIMVPLGGGVGALLATLFLSLRSREGTSPSRLLFVGVVFVLLILALWRLWAWFTTPPAAS